ncbi:MAG: serine hydrolase [Candidatus Saccharimonadales bacterium]
MKKHTKIGLTVLGVIAIAVIAGLGYWYQAYATPEVSSEAYAPADESAQDSLSADRVNTGRLRSFVKTKLGQPVDTTNLDSQINAIISQNSDIHISVAIKDLNTGSVHNYGKQEAMTAASVTKVLTAVDFLKQVELGYKSLDMIMADGNTAQYNIEQMIVYSDNDAWHTLNDSLTYPQLQSYAESIGLTSYYYYGNTIGTADVTKLFGDMYQRKLINESHTQLLLSYMERETIVI